MLAQLGSVQFEVWPVNIHEHTHEGRATFAEKPVMGRRPPLEFVGEGPDSRTPEGQALDGRLDRCASPDAHRRQSTAIHAR